jgi:hypothetical protein
MRSGVSGPRHRHQGVVDGPVAALAGGGERGARGEVGLGPRIGQSL